MGAFRRIVHAIGRPRWFGVFVRTVGARADRLLYRVSGGRTGARHTFALRPG
jgi:hypothetical protein